MPRCCSELATVTVQLTVELGEVVIAMRMYDIIGVY